jgi:hypothetical protein
VIAIDTITPGDVPFMNLILAQLEEKNGNLAYRAAIEEVRRDCAAEIIDRWKDRLSVTDIYAESHRQTFIIYFIMH